MGYELNRLMKQYGVATPTMASAPQMPGAAPIEADYTGAEGSPGDAAKYAADKAAFDESVRKYGLAQKEYDQYKSGYQDRLANTNMYNQAQFSTTGANVPAATTFSDAQKYATGALPAVEEPVGAQGFAGLGQSGLNQRIREYMAGNPSQYGLEEAKKRYGVTDADIRNAMGTGTQYGTPQWTDTVQAPSYGVAPMTLAGKTMQDKANWYLGQRDIGYTDADLRSGFEKTFGPIDDVAWLSLLNTAYPQAGVDWNPAKGDAYDLSKVPQNFDWAYYVNQNPDIYQAGVNTMPEAQMHYAAYGMNEGRSPYEGWTPPPSTPVVNTNTNTNTNTGGGFSWKDYLDGKYGDGQFGYYRRYYRKGGQVRAHAEGGAVKGYQDGGLEDRGMIDPETGAVVYAVPPQPEITSRPIYDDPVPEGAAQAIDRSEAPAAPAAPATPADARAATLQAMLDRYGPQNVDYSGQIGAARERQSSEQRAFEEMLRSHLESPEDTASSKAEMYFRLASAFGAPTKTGHFTENLSMAGKEMAETAKGKRESSAKKRDLMIEVQKMKMGAAKDDLAALQALEAESMKDRRAIAQKLIEDYITSGKPQSTAGKQAADLGYIPGTPEYHAEVKRLTQLDIDKQTAAINAQVASTKAINSSLNKPLSTAGKQAADLGFIPGTPEYHAEVRELSEGDSTQALSTAGKQAADMGFQPGTPEYQKMVRNLIEGDSTQATRKSAGKMSPTEIKLRTETENNLANLNQSLLDVAEAYKLNPNSYAGGSLNKVQRGLYEIAGSDDPKLVNTRRIDNLLGAQALNSLRETFGSNPTNTEREVLLELQGIGAKSIEERRQIMLRTYKVLQARKSRQQQRLDSILSGEYHSYSPVEGDQ